MWFETTLFQKHFNEPIKSCRAVFKRVAFPNQIIKTETHINCRFQTNIELWKKNQFVNRFDCRNTKREIYIISTVLVLKTHPLLSLSLYIYQP